MTILVATAALFLFLLAFGGGASRADVLSLPFVRGGAVLVLMAAALVIDPRAEKPLQPLWIFAGVCAALLLIELVPLPPALWTLLPGRQIAAAGAAAAGLPQPWRPIALSHDGGVNAALAILPPLATLAAISFLREKGLRFVVYGALAILLLSAMLGAVQTAAGAGSALRLYRITNQDASVGLFANRNHQAFLLACGFPLLTWLLQRHGDALRSVELRFGLGLACFLFLMAMILATGSRGGAVLGATSALLTLFLSTRGVRIERRWLLIGGIAVIGAGALALALGSQVKTFERLTDGGEGSELRLALLGDYWRLIQSHFPFGSGFGSFVGAYQVIERPENLAPEYLNAAHNDLVQLGIEGGIFGWGLLLVFLFWWTRAAWRILRLVDSRKDRSRIALGRLGTLTTLLLLLGSLTDYPLRTPILASLFVAACAMMAYAQATQRNATA